MSNQHAQRNQAVLTGAVTHIEPLRHTPAGVPVLSLRLQHQSCQQLGEFQRQLDFEFSVRAVGSIAQQLSDVVEIDSNLCCWGVMAPGHRSSSFLLLHLQKFELLNCLPQRGQEENHHGSRS